MAGTKTIRERLGDDPRFRIPSPEERTGDEDFAAFSESDEKTACVDAKLVEGEEFRTIDVERSEESEFTHFLDGTQWSRCLLYDEYLPAYISYVSAAVLRRIEGNVQPPSGAELAESLCIFGPKTTTDLLRGWSYEGRERSVFRDDVKEMKATDDDTEYSFREGIQSAISSERELLENEVASNFWQQEKERGWLLVDGGIGRVLSQNVNADRIVGIVKTHKKKQYFRTQKQRKTILSLALGQRTSMFLREEDRKQGAAAFSFYLKLRHSDTQSPLFGVVRVELPARAESIEMANQVAAWIFHERNPLSLPDRRFDRLLYPIHLVEMQLKARQPSDAAIIARIG